MKADFIKRLLAYLIDIFIVIIITQLITGFIPTSAKIEKSSQNIINLTKQAADNEISTKDFQSQVLNEQYTISRETVIQELISIVIYILYFVLFSYYKEGQTIGKRLLKLRIKRKYDDKLTINSLVIRAFVLYNIALKILDELLIVSLHKNNYLKCSQISGVLNIIVITVLVFMVIIRKDGRGLHDFVSGTIVVNEEESK